MTTSQPPEAVSLASWEAAFAYPMPIVRKLEVQLRKNIEENRGKLRTLVGTRYRDLMGTAERIIAMDAHMAQAERNLSEIGRKCNADAVEQVQRHSAAMRTAVDPRRLADGMRGSRRECSGTSLAASALTKAVVDTMAAAARIIRTPVRDGGGDARLAAKLLVLARLLLKSATDLDQETRPGLLEALRKRMLGLRKKLLAHIERKLVAPKFADDSERTEEIREKLEQERADGLINSLCAYALITSSAPADVLRYFLQSRFAQLTVLTETSATKESELLEILDLYGQTLSDTRMLFPRPLLDALAAMSQDPLLRDPQIVSLYELSLDIYMTWIPENVRTFTPWIRRDQISTSTVDAALKSWAGEAQGALVRAVKGGIAMQKDIKAVLAVRQKVLSRYLSLGTQVRQINPLAAVHQLQAAFRERLQALAGDCASQIQIHAAELVDDDSEPETLWDLAAKELPTSNGGLRLRNAILQRRHGRGRTLHAVSRRLDQWVASIAQFWDVTMGMRTTRWADEVDLEDLADIDDADVPLPDMLNKDDPKSIQETLQQAVIHGLTSLYTMLASNAPTDDSSPVQLLRLFREVDIRRRKIETHLSLATQDYETQAVVTSLQRRLAESVLHDAWQAFSVTKVSPFDSDTYLWEGSPPLPVQPSPQVFRLFVELQKRMAAKGSDLWTGSATDILRRLLRDNFLEWLQSETSGLKSENSQDENKEDDEKLDSNKSLVIQRIFDVLFVEHLTARSSSDTRVNSFMDSTYESTSLETAERDRLQKSATEYWKRTYLLFGLLAS